MAPAAERGQVAMKHETSKLKTVGDLIRWGVSRLNEVGRHFGHGTDNAADEARVLVFHALSLDFAVPEYFYAARVTPAERDAAVALIRRRIDEGCPAAYLTGEAWFAGLRFEVTPDVLVPRSPIAELIQNGFRPWCEADDIKNALDIGTGSGCIAVAIAAYLGVHVDAVDISPAAVEVARRNLAAHDLGDFVDVMESDLYAGVQGRSYDLIVSNPPYVGAASMASLPDEYAREPEIALAAGEDGLQLIHRILHGAADHLNPGGLLVVEAGESAAALADAYPDVPFEWCDFANGGSGVLVLRAADVDRFRSQFGRRCA